MKEPRLEKRRDVIRYYNQLSKSYDELYSTEQLRKYEVILDFLIPSGTILDLACGTGNFLLESVKTAELAVGLDISVNMVKRGQEKLRKYPNAELVVGDAHLMPFREVFDEIYIITAIHIFDDLRSVTFEVNRVLKGFPLVITLLRKASSLFNKVNEYFKSNGFILSALIDRREIADLILLYIREGIRFESRIEARFKGSYAVRKGRA